MENSALEVGRKIQKYFADQGISQAAAGELLGISQGAVSARLCGIKPFGFKAALKWHEAFGFRVNWLRTGEGPMFEEGAVSNNTAGGDMVINSPGAVLSSEGGDVRVYKDLYEKSQKEIVELKTKIFKLMDRLSEHGLDCEC